MIETNTAATILAVKARKTKTDKKLGEFSEAIISACTKDLTFPLIRKAVSSLGSAIKMA